MVQKVCQRIRTLHLVSTVPRATREELLAMLTLPFCCSILMAGILPFGAMFIELFFIFSVSTTSLWGWVRPQEVGGVLPHPSTHNLHPHKPHPCPSTYMLCLLPPERFQMSLLRSRGVRSCPSRWLGRMNGMWHCVRDLCVGRAQ